MEDDSVLEPHREEVVKAMMGFGAKIREAWANRLGNILGGERLTDRDWTLLEVLNERGETPFSEAVKIASGSAKGGSQAAVTAAIGRMSKQWKLLTTKRTKEDERRKTVTVTPKGKRLLEQRATIRAEMYKKIFECWQPFENEESDLEVVARLFRNGIENADEVFGNDA